MTEESVPVEDLPGEWSATPTEHPEVPSSDPVVECEAGESPPLTVCDVRRNVELRFGVAVAIYDVHGDLHVYPQDPMGADDVLLHVFERSADSRIEFGNRTKRVHYHGNTTDEIRRGILTNDAIGLVIHRADGGRQIVTGGRDDSERVDASE